MSSSGVGQVQLPADTTPGAEYQLDSVAEVGHDPGEGAADPIFVGVHINDQELLMELDTGAKFPSFLRRSGKISGLSYLFLHVMSV